MTDVPFDSGASRALNAAANERLVRGALFMAVFLHLWLTANPFPDLSDAKLLEAGADGNLLGQTLAVLLTGTLAVFAFANRWRLVAKAVTPILIVVFLWFACSAVLSMYPALAIRRLVLASFVIFQAAMFVLLPQDRDHFARLLALGAGIVLVLCYAGVVFLPDLSIHQPSDIAEPQLAGNWRGFFAHKNGAGAGMAILIIFGIYICRTFNALVGALIIVFAALFLALTESKSPITLLPLALAVSIVFVWLRNPVAKFIVAFGVSAIIAVLTVGSVQFDAVYALVEKLMSDPTFTGRNDIWEFTLAHIAQHPVFGFGYQAFWGTAELVNSWTWTESWGYRASDAHNGYLNVAVMTGIVGLLLALAWVFVQPLRDHLRTPPDRVDPPLNMMFIQTWLFAIYLCGFESELFNSGSVVWFMTAASIIGLRLQATTEFAAETG